MAELLQNQRMKLGSNGDSAPPSHGDGITSPPAGEGCSRPFLLAVTAVLLVASLAIGSLVGRCSAERTFSSASATTLRPAPSVITAIRDLSRLEAAEFHVERVIDLTDQQTRFFGLIRTEDALLLVASGSVLAGVDLAELDASDIVLDETTKRANIRLPAVQIFSARLDNQRTYVHTRKTGALARRDESLEAKARQEAERSIVEAAKQGGIFQRAEQNAKRTIETLIRSLGYATVSVTFSPK